jgi:hypothetical protein
MFFSKLSGISSNVETIHNLFTVKDCKTIQISKTILNIFFPIMSNSEPQDAEPNPDLGSGSMHIQNYIRTRIRIK